MSITVCCLTDEQIKYIIKAINTHIDEGKARWDDEILKEILIELECRLEKYCFYKGDEYIV